MSGAEQIVTVIIVIALIIGLIVGYTATRTNRLKYSDDKWLRFMCGFIIGVGGTFSIVLMSLIVWMLVVVIVKAGG